MSESAQLDPCAWCGEPAITEVLVVRGRKNRRTKPVCLAHAVQFETQGQITTRIETDQLAKREAKRAEFMRRTMPWLR
jgi:hypothetical protein